MNLLIRLAGHLLVVQAESEVLLIIGRLLPVCEERDDEGAAHGGHCLALEVLAPRETAQASAAVTVHIVHHDIRILQLHGRCVEDQPNCQALEIV